MNKSTLVVTISNESKTNRTKTMFLIIIVTTYCSENLSNDAIDIRKK